ncbi:hypothetical protein N2152v2_002916 [Parachlorella kessleri]
MSRRGVWQLKKLVLNYCDHSGSSKGAREFLEHVWPQFTKDNPHLAAEAVLRRGRHPFLEASYLTGNVRSVDLRNNTPEEILRQAVLLRSSAGRKASLQVKQRTVTKQPSIQGQWTGELQQQLKQQEAL